VRDFVYRHDALASLAEFLRVHDQQLPLDDAGSWTEGEWVLAIFEVGKRGRATAAVGSVTLREGAAFVAFDRRDWERIHEFASSHADDSLNAIFAAAPARPTVDSIRPDVRRGDQRGSLLDVSVQGARILVVDGDSQTLMRLQAAVQASRIEVEGVSSAEDAIAELASGRFEVVVTEFELPGLTGIELCRRLRDHERLDALPVVIVTEMDDWRVRTEAFGVGADDWLRKPVNGDELGARCIALVRRFRHAQRQLGHEP
jgi:two-component system phosphate regulon response regulator PhoB